MELFLERSPYEIDNVALPIIIRNYIHHEKIYIDVSYMEKDKVKELGAKWDNMRQKRQRFLLKALIL